MVHELSIGHLVIALLFGGNFSSVSSRVRFQFQCMLGSTTDVNVYIDPWLSTVPLIASPTNLNMGSQCLDTQVADVITPPWAWNMPLLASLFSADMTA